uniref:Uncharacterized protein n=1 Tax=Tanacetum cinerariifolium TaxID=118510 RepID=A0A6L2LR96_TANCI|nr:hypothetical protein [Tanacetum cinerariifolium]
MHEQQIKQLREELDKERATTGILKRMFLAEPEDSKKMDEDSKIIEGLWENNEILKAHIRHLKKYLNQAISGQQEDVCFTMPLCRSKVEQDTAEDLIELSHIKRHSVEMWRSRIVVAGCGVGGLDVSVRMAQS